MGVGEPSGSSSAGAAGMDSGGPGGPGPRGPGEEEGGDGPADGAAPRGGVGVGRHETTRGRAHPATARGMPIYGCATCCNPLSYSLTSRNTFL